MAARPTLPEALSAELWEEAQPLLRSRPRPTRPVLVVFAGPPLAGKTTLARTLEVRARTATFGVENDEVRARVVRRLGRDAPDFGARENFFTYRTAWDLVAHALGSRVNAVHDATNLTESARRGAYAVADAARAEVVVALVLTDPATLGARAEAADADRQRAWRKLGARRPDPARVRRRVVVLDGAAPVSVSMDALAREPLLREVLGAGPP